MNKQQIVQQTRLAFDFLEKLYFEVSYLIKEVEGLLADEEEEFVIGRPAGYAITTRSSQGLETANVHLWPLRKLAVFFVPKGDTRMTGGTTNTKLEGTKVLYLRIVLDDKDLAEPSIYFGVLYGFKKKNAEGQTPTKFEHLMGSLEYGEARVFGNPEAIEYEDSRVRFRGRLLRANLYDITNSEQIASQIIAPALSTFRELG